MSRRTPSRPRAPWHAPASRRAGRIAPGLPTALVGAVLLLPIGVHLGATAATGAVTATTAAVSGLTSPEADGGRSRVRPEAYPGDRGFHPHDR